MAYKKLAHSLVKRRLLDRKKKYKPKGEKTTPFSESEGARVDPETGGSVDTSRKLEARRLSGVEKITKGKASGDRGIVAESTSKGMIARSKRVANLETKEEKGIITKEEKRELDRKTAKDVADKARADRTAAATRKANAAKEAGKDKRDPRDTLMQTGEIMEGYNPTDREMQQAISNLNARKTDPKIRERMALLERRLTNAPQTKGLSRESRKELLNKKPKGMKTKSYKKGGKIGRGCGAALRGGGKVMR